MGIVQDAYDHAYRDFVVAGVRSSGRHEPLKSDIRAIATFIEQLLAASGLTTIHETPEDGIAATDPDDLFLVQGTGETFATLYKNDAGSAVSQGISLPSTVAVDALSLAQEAMRQGIDQPPIFNGNRLTEVKALNIVPPVTGVTTVADDDGAPIGFTIASGQTGQSASILAYPLNNKAEIAALAGETIRFYSRYYATANFLANKPLSDAYVDINRYIGTTDGELVYEGQDGTVLTRIVDYTIVGDEDFIGPVAEVSLSAGTTGTAMTLRLESVSYAVLNDAAATIDAALDNKSASRFGASVIKEAQPGIGELTSTAEFIRDPVTNFINGYQTPDGVNSFESSFSWYWLLAPEDFPILRSARIRLTVALDTSDDYSRALEVLVSTVNRESGGGAMAEQNVLSVRKYPNRQVYVIEGIVDSGTEQIVVTFNDLTDAVSSGDEYFAVADVQIEVLSLPDGSLSPTQATMMLQRNIASRIERALPVEKVTVAADGSGDYLHLFDALDNATANQVIEVKAGLYTPSTAELACFPTFVGSRIRGAGAGRPQIVFAQPASTTPADIEAKSASDFHLSGEVRNIHFIAQNARYASHPDAGGGYYNQTLTFADCVFEHRGNEAARTYQVGLGNPSSIVWRNTYGVGLGTGSGGKFTYDGCRMLGYNAAAFYGHSWGQAVNPSRLTIRNSLLDPQIRDSSAIFPYSFFWQNLGSQQPDLIELTGNTLVGPIAAGGGTWQGTDAAKTPANKMTFSIIGHSNTPVAYALEDDGSRALRITSATTGASSTVAVSGTGATALLGASGITSAAGAAGLKGYSYGWLDVGDHGVGPGADLNVTQLGKRLGNCTSVNKVMSVVIDGGAPITVTFSADHTNQSNATVLAIINAALGSAATADLFNVNELFRPSFTDEETRVYNAGATTILRKRAVARIVGVDHPNARVMNSTDAAELFVGIAYEDIKPGEWGRVKSAGCIRASMDLARTDGASFVAGDTFGVSDGGGQFAKGAAITLLTAISSVDLRLSSAAYVTRDDLEALSGQVAGALSNSEYRPTLAEAISDLAVGVYFNSDDQDEAGPHPGVRWIYQRTGTTPFYTAVRAWAVKADVGLSEVDNTSDLDKPISTAVQDEFDATNDKIDRRAIWFASRASLVAGADDLPSGAVAHDGIVSYVKDGGSSITDLADWSALGGIIDVMHHYDPTDSGIQQAINRAITAASALGGGAVMLVNKGAVYAATGSIVPKTGAHLVGIGRPTIRLANGVNKSLIESDNFLALSGTNSGLGVSNVSIRDMILDANRANNTGAGANEGHCVALFGRDFLLQDLLLKDARRRGLHTEYGTGAVGVSPFNARLRGVTINTAGEDGWYNKVSDLHLDSVNIRSAGQNTDNSFDAIYLGASGGVRGVNLNVWRGGGGASTTHRYSLNIEGGASTIQGLNLETAKTANLRLGSNRNSITGLVSYNMLAGALHHAIMDGNSNTLDMIVQAGGVSGEATTAYGVKLGDANAVSSNKIHVAMTGHSGGLVNFANSDGLNEVTGQIYRPTGGAFYTGTVHATDTVDITASGATNTEQASYSKKAGSGGSITPVGTTQAGAALLRHTVNRVYTTSSSNDATLLPKAAAGLELTVGNIGTVTISVFPTGADNHQGLAASAAYTIPAGASRIFKALSSTEWGAV